MFKHIFLSICIAILFNSCIVSKKKYDDLLAQKVRLEADLSDRSAELEKSNADVTDLSEKLKKLKEDTTNLGIDLRNNSQRLTQLQKEHEQMNASYKNLLTSSGKVTRDLAEHQEQLLAIQDNLDK